MTESKKKLFEIGIIVTAGIFLLFKFAQSYMVKKSGGEIRIEAPSGFDLAEAKKALSNIGGIKDRAAGIEKNLRNLFEKPKELATLEEKMLYGPPPEEAAIEAEPLALEGIMTGGSKGNLAIISGKVFAEGDIVGEAKILKIEPGRVVLLKNGSQVELKR